MNPLEIVENALQTEAGPDLVAACYQIVPSQVDEISHGLRRWAEDFSPPQRRPTELRPLIRRHQHLWGRLDFEPPALPYIAADELKQYLLFSHTIAVEENISHPLREISRTSGGLETVRNFFPPSVASMVSLADLIRQGIVILIPGSDMLSGDALPTSTESESIAAPDSWKKAVEEWAANNIEGWTNKSIPRVHFPSFEGHSGVRTDLAGNSRELTEIDYQYKYFGYSFSDMVSSMGRVMQLNHAVNINFPTPLDLDVFELFLQEGVASLQRIGNDASTLNHLLRLELPNISALSVRDIINIRTNDEIFDRWRSQLSLALQSAQLSHEPHDAWTLRRSIRDSEQALRRELQQRSLKGLGKQGVRDLLLGSVGVTTGATVFQSLSTATAAGITGLAGRILLEFGLKLHRRNPQDALLAHYSVLSEPHNPDE